MENQPQSKEKKSCRDLSNDDFQSMLALLDTMFQDDYFNEKSKGYKKAKLTFDKLKHSKCKAHEFNLTLREFSNRHTLNFWMPAHIYQIWKEEFAPIGVIM